MNGRRREKVVGSLLYGGRSESEGVRLKTKKKIVSLLQIIFLSSFFLTLSFTR